jgi:hypothetical protein
MSEEEYYAKLSQRVGETIEDLKKEFAEILAEVNSDEKLAAYNDEQKQNLAKNRFSIRKIRASAIPNLISWEGIVIGVGDLIDTVSRQKKATDAAFKADALKTVKGWNYNEVSVLSDTNGTPLYPKTELNTKFGRAGKPLPEHSWLRSIYAVARPIDPKTKQPGPVQFTKIMVNNAPAIDASKFPTMQKVKFKAINKTTENDRLTGEYTANFSAFTKFEPAEFDMPPIEEILPAMPQYVTLGDLDEYHTKNSNNPRRFVITEGTVVNMNLEPNPKTGNIYLIVSDESLLFSGTDKTGIMNWIPTDRNIVVDFAVESRVFVVGKTTRGQARDPITKETLEGVPGDVMLNVYGLYAPEMFKVAPEIQPVTEESISAETEAKEW